MLERRIGKLNPEASAPPREEWAMFVDCPEEQLVPCFYYEHARHTPEICEGVKRYRQCDDPCLDGVSGLAYQGGFSLYLACVLYPFRSYFPHTPWLDLPDNERKSFADLTNTKQHLNTFDWEAQIHAGYGSCTGSVDKLKDKRFRSGKHIDLYLDHRCHNEDGSPVTYFVHRVNWKKSDNVLVAEFQEWLCSHRPRPPRETRGKTSPRERLKALGAMLWLKRFDWEQAAVETQKQLGKPLYGEQSEWIDAARSAEDFLKIFPILNRHVG